MHGGEDRLEFVNDITREYVYSEMNLVQRTRLHRTTGTLLANVYGTSNATIARHFHLGDDRDKTYDYAILAAKEASASGGHQEAAGMAELARQTARSREHMLDALSVLADSELLCGRLQQAKDHYLDLLEHQPELSPKRRVEIKLRVVEVH